MQPSNKRVFRIMEEIFFNCNKLLEKPSDLKEILALQNAIKSKIEKFLNSPNFDSKINENFEILWQSRAIDSLFLLLISDSLSNKECANDCIRMFTLNPKSPSKLNVNEWCGLILIHFCSLLLRHVSQSELQITQSQIGSAYNTCKVSLVNLIQKFGQIHSIPQFNYLSPFTAKQALLPFISESISRISSSLVLTYNSLESGNETMINSVNGYDCKSFSSFLTAFCAATVSQIHTGSHCNETNFPFLQTDMTSLTRRNPHSKNDSCSFQTSSSSSINSSLSSSSIDSSLTSLSLHFMLEVDSFLDKLFTKAKSLLRSEPATCQNLMLHIPVSIQTHLPIIISGFYSLSKTDSHFQTQFSQFLHYQKTNLNCFLKQDSMTKTNELWEILKSYSLLELEAKEKWFYWNLPQLQSDHCDKPTVIISREEGNILNQVFGQLSECNAHTLKSGVCVQFLGEEGEGTGVLREFFCLLVKEMFDAHSALFQSSPSDYRCFTPYHSSSVNEHHLDYFRLCGRLIALVMAYRIPTGLKFSLPFFHLLVKKEIKMEDMAELDAEFYESCIRIMELSAEEMSNLCLFFSSTVDHFGANRTVDLVQGGENRAVNEQNRSEFVHLVLQNKIRCIMDQTSSFSFGFEEMLMDGMKIADVTSDIFSSSHPSVSFTLLRPFTPLSFTLLRPLFFFILYFNLLHHFSSFFVLFHLSSTFFIFLYPLLNPSSTFCIPYCIPCFILLQLLDPLDACDFNHFLCGKEERMDMEDWKAHTQLHGYDWDDIQIKNFWKLLNELNNDDLQKLFFFVTATNHLPYGGFGALPSKFHIHRQDVELSFLPSSRTCFFQLFLPPYDSFALMKTKFEMIFQSSAADGFGFV